MDKSLLTQIKGTVTSTLTYNPVADSNAIRLEGKTLTWIKTSTKRHIVKAITWRVWSTFLTASVAYYLTSRWDVAITIGVFDAGLKMVTYFAHEHFWHRIGVLQPKNRPFVVWFTGLSGAGKTTIALELSKLLKRKNQKIHMLDGDEIRQVFPKTGFSKEDRMTHVKRVGFLASTLEKNGISSVVTLISPFTEARDFCRQLSLNFVEIHIATSLDQCEKRDPKGLYKMARAGEISQFTGLDSPYEPPINPEMVIQTDGISPEQCAAKIAKYLSRYDD